MDLIALNIQRKGLRIAFTHTLKKIDIELAKEVRDLKILSILKYQLSDKFQRLEVCQNAISERVLQSSDAEQLFNEDFEEAETYRDRFLEQCAQIDSEVKVSALPSDNTETRKFKLPTIELKKFSGEAKDYLTFWSQFQKIHDDKTIADEDKMQYLIQAMEPKSKAERLVLSFPATAANYPKAIAQLKERFGRDDLLVQIYVRDLLSLVMKNAASGRIKTDLPSLYDELEGKLRALESLGRTQEKYGDFLTPLVESCLPEEILVAWERSRNHDSTETKGTRTLESLMNFLRQEVKGEEMVLLARTGFAPHQSHRKKDFHPEQLRQADPVTASALVSLDNSDELPSTDEETNHPSESPNDPPVRKRRSAQPPTAVEDMDVLSKSLQKFINDACEGSGIITREHLQAFFHDVKKESNVIEEALKYVKNLPKFKVLLQSISKFFYSTTQTGTKEDKRFIKWLDKRIGKFDKTVPQKRKRTGQNQNDTPAKK